MISDSMNHKKHQQFHTSLFFQELAGRKAQNTSFWAKF